MFSARESAAGGRLTDGGKAVEIVASAARRAAARAGGPQSRARPPCRLTGAGAPAASPARRFGVLVVDDDPRVLGMASALLALEGALAFKAAGCAAAQRALREHAGLIDAALIDLEMPGEDGLETCRLLRRATPGLRCCLMSDVDLEGASLPEGFRCALGKPFTAARLRVCLGLLRAVAR